MCVRLLFFHQKKKDLTKPSSHPHILFPRKLYYEENRESTSRSEKKKKRKKPRTTWTQSTLPVIHSIINHLTLFIFSSTLWTFPNTHREKKMLKLCCVGGCGYVFSVACPAARFPCTARRTLQIICICICTRYLKYISILCIIGFVHLCNILCI